MSDREDRLQEVVNELAGAEDKGKVGLDQNGIPVCIYCGQARDRLTLNIQHTPDCLITRARKLATG